MNRFTRDQTVYDLNGNAARIGLTKLKQVPADAYQLESHE